MLRLRHPASDPLTDRDDVQAVSSDAALRPPRLRVKYCSFDARPLQRASRRSRFSASPDLIRWARGVWTINCPTVPRGAERLRFTPGPAHSKALMREWTDASVEICDRLRLHAAA
ncbi:hypothetical protein SPHINGO8AM_150090 [Sphingomonas sp. 8AM]|nr:hypothetical protein SPHINGO8AM_150090 [Sphingomonas sp. 8AM]